MVIIYMRIRQSLILLVVLGLAIATNADNTDYAYSGALGEVIDPPPFQLMDLTALLQALNVTYQQVAQNLSTLNTASPSSTAPGASSPPASNPSQTQTPAAPQGQTTSPAADSKPAKTGSEASKPSTPASSKPVDDSKAIISTPKAQTDNIKPTASPVQAPASPTKPPTTQTYQPTKPASSSQPGATAQNKQGPSQNTQTSASSTDKYTQKSPSVAPTSSPSTNPPSASSQTSSSSNNIPTFGPGPQDKSLPAVIDISKLVVHTPAVPSTPSSTSDGPTSSSQPNPPTPKPTAPSLSQPTVSPSKPSSVITQPASTPSSPVGTSSQANTQTQTKSSPTQSTVSSPSQPVEKKPDNVKPPTVDDTYIAPSKPSTPAPTPVPQKPSPSIIYTSSQPKTINEVYISPLASPGSDNFQPKTTGSSNLSTDKSSGKPSSNIVLSEKRQQSKSSPASYQCWTSSQDAIYNITASYKAFSKYFIITAKDAYLPNIQAYLLSNYGNYLSGSRLLAGFRIYNSYGDNSLDYQLLLSTNYGIFVSILTYWPDTANIQLKSLSILNFFIMEIDYSNCQEPDPAQQNCKVCNEGFRNFFGRCSPYNPACLSYISDECGKCGQGQRLSNGICQ